MVKFNYDLVVVGGGPAGMAAALAAKEKGISDILIIERDNRTGGILNQCIHNGFGLHYFKEELTGPEYAHKFTEKIMNNIEVKLNTMVLDITSEKIVTAINDTDGIFEIKAKAVILAMGCRERPRGALNISGTRPSGVFTAGAAQKYINIDGYMPGREVVILGSGDIGLIMARRMTLEGGTVKAVCELMPYSSGLKRNIVQCLDDFNIPLKLSTTVVKTHGNNRLEGVTIAQVDENLKPIKDTYEFIKCDTLLLSVGLIPENELSKKAGVDMDLMTSGGVVDENMETNISGIFACGNVVHVHDLVDFVTLESYIAGESAANYILEENNIKSNDFILTKAEKGIRYIVPQKINRTTNRDKIQLSFRPTNMFRDIRLNIKVDGDIVKTIKKKHMAPSEMEKIQIDKSIIDFGKVKEISIELEV